MTLRRGTRALVATIVLGLVLAGCFGDATPPPPTTTPQPATTPAVTFYRIDTTVWIEGLVVTINSATSTLDRKGGSVSVSLNISNPGTTSATLDAPIHLVAAGKTFELVHGTDLPEVTGGDVVGVTVEFDVLGRATVDDALIRIGRPQDHQAVIPLRAGQPGRVTLEPRAADLTGGVTSGGLKVALRSGEIRWDLGDWYQELPAATEVLTVSYDLTYTGSFSGGYAFTGDNVALRLPDGTVVGPRRDGHSQSIVLVGPHKTATSLFSRFEIPAGVTGAFALILTDGSSHKAATFQIGP